MQGCLHLSRLSEIEDHAAWSPNFIGGEIGCIQEKQLTQVTVRVGGKARTLTHGTFHHRKAVGSVHRRQAHASSVNSKGLPGSFSSPGRRIVSRKYKQKTLNSHQLRF